MCVCVHACVCVCEEASMKFARALRSPVHLLVSDSNSDDFDPASTKSKYDSMDFDSLLKEAQRSLRR